MSQNDEQLRACDQGRLRAASTTLPRLVRKRITTREDGRYVIYYEFEDRPVETVQPQAGETV